jgi:hypothetical protein
MKSAFGKKAEKTEVQKTKYENMEQDAQQVKSAFLQGITEKQKQMAQDSDTEFFVCIAFQNREQKEDFLKKKGWIKYGDKYYAGVDIAKHENVEIKIDTAMRKKFKFKPGFKTL